jgi:hypothetical protein
MKSILIILLSFLPLLSYSTNYYLSSTGNNANTGLGQSDGLAWQTVSAPNAFAFSPGDSILFKRGEIFYGTLTFSESGTLGNPIVIGAWGSGADPIISGGIDIDVTNHWNQRNGNVYRIYCTSDIKGVFINDKQYMQARYPNAGNFVYITTGDATSPYTLFSVAALSFADGTLNGTRARFRSTNWTYENKLVSTQVGDDITLATGATYANKINYGVYFDSLYSFLDTVGEYFYNSTTDSLYIYFESVADTNDVEVIVSSDGINTAWNASYFTVDNIHFTLYDRDAIQLEGTAHGITVKNCIFDKIIKNGIKTDNYLGNDLTIYNNTFNNINGNGMYLCANRGTITYNTLTNIGIVPGYGISGDNANNGIYTRYTSDSLNFYYNTFNKIGGHGIRLTGFNHNFYYNRLDTIVYTLNDMGAVYTYYSTTTPSRNIKIKHNIINYVPGNLQSSGATLLAPGIYLDGTDNKYAGHFVDSNTVSNCDIGIFVQYTYFDLSLTGNVLYNNFTGIDVLSSNDTFNFKKNTIISLSKDNLSSWIRYYNLTHATIDSNWYINPYTETSFVSDTTTYDHYINIERIRAKYSYDLHSTISSYKWKPYEVTSYVDANRLSNGRFASASTGWSGNQGTFAWNATSSLDTGAISFRGTTAFSSNTRVMSPVIDDTLKSGRWYELRGDIIGSYPGTFTAQSEAQVSWTATYGLSERFSFKTTRDSFNLVGQATATGRSHLAFLFWAKDSLCYFDNMSFREVNVEYHNPADRLILFTNPTSSPVVQSLATGIYYDKNNVLAGNSVTIPAYSSVFYYKLGTKSAATRKVLILNGKILMSNGKVITVNQ